MMRQEVEEMSPNPAEELCTDGGKVSHCEHTTGRLSSAFVLNALPGLIVMDPSVSMVLKKLVITAPSIKEDTSS